MSAYQTDTVCVLHWSISTPIARPMVQPTTYEHRTHAKSKSPDPLKIDPYRFLNLARNQVSSHQTRSSSSQAGNQQCVASPVILSVIAVVYNVNFGEL